MKKFFQLIFLEKTDNTIIQLFRYGIVGTATFFVDAGLLYLLTLSVFFIDYYLIAVIISSMTALACTYFLSIFWVFKKRTVINRRFEFVVFCVIGIIGIVFNFLIVWLFTDYLLGFVENKQMRIMFSKIIATTAVFFWNFILRKILLFGEMKKRNPA